MKNFSREMETIKRNKIKMSEMKKYNITMNTYYEFNSKLLATEKSSSKLQDRSIIQTEIKRKKM
jgi:hypothetical protein